MSLIFLSLVNRTATVTVIFLPLSFVAAFFAISIRILPHSSSDGNQEMSLGYATKYVFGAGLVVALCLVVITLEINFIASGVTWSWKQCTSVRKPPKHVATPGEQGKPQTMDSIDFKAKFHNMRPRYFPRSASGQQGMWTNHDQGLVLGDPTKA